MSLRWGLPFLFHWLGTLASAADHYRVDPGRTIWVLEFGTGRLVKNTGPSPLFIPTKTTQEWNAFIANKPSYVLLYSCPSNYIGVPHDTTNTTDAFCVMAYEAKNVSGNPTSQAALTPWTSINNTNARAECQSLGTGYDLLTNSEWQTIYHNVELVGSNWSSGTVGSGCMRMGNSSYAMSNCSYNGSNPEFGTGRNALASMTLSTGEVIWDINANVHEHIISAPDPIPGTLNSYRTYAATGTAKTLWGPSGNYSANCGGADPNYFCGQGWLQYGNGSGGTGSFDMRGGAYDNDWGISGMHSGYSNLNDPSVGFRCKYKP